MLLSPPVPVLCADVSGAAHGGQVLMDAATFTAVKEALWRLGAVGPAGLDYDALLATKSARHSMGGTSSSICVGDGCLPGLMPAGGFRWGSLVLVVPAQHCLGSWGAGVRHLSPTYLHVGVWWTAVADGLCCFD